MASKIRTYHIPTNLNFTKEGWENFKKEQDELTKKRPEAVARMAEMRAQGDLSENAGYHAAKQTVASIDRRLRELKIYLRFGKIIESNNKGYVDLGSTVTVSDGAEDMEFMIVGPTEANPLDGKLSNKSPIGSALMGKRVGEKVEIKVPAGTVNYTIKLIK